MGKVSNFFNGGSTSGDDGDREGNRRAALKSNLKIQANQKHFMNLGALQSTSLLQTGAVQSPGLTKIHKGAKVQNSPFLKDQDSLDKMINLFNNRRLAIQGRIAFPGNSVFLSGRN